MATMTADTLPEIMTVDEVAAYLRLDRKTVYEAIKHDKVPGAHRVGRVIRVYRRALLRWLSSGTEGLLGSSQG